MKSKVEIASEIYSELCHYYTRCLVQQNKPKRGLLTLRTAIRNIQLDSTGTQVKTKLTTVHSDLLQLSLMAKNFTVALDVMSHEILDIHKPPNSKFDSKYLLGYFYYAGCVYTAMKLFDKALFYFEQTLCVPALVVSQIMVEAFKKYIMIALISKGNHNILFFEIWTFTLLYCEIKSKLTTLFIWVFGFCGTCYHGLYRSVAFFISQNNWIRIC